MLKSLALGVVAVTLAAGCRSNEAADDGSIPVPLTPGDSGGVYEMRFSPKAATVLLNEVGGGLEGNIVLGSTGMTPFRARLEKSGTYPYFDILRIDADRNGAFEEDEALSTVPNEVRYAMWSSFDTELDVPVLDSVSGDLVLNPYPVSLWYVEQLREEQATEPALRFTRRGWMQGRATIEGVDAHVRVAESELDGVFTLDDGWTLAPADSVQNIFAVDHERPGRRHAWLGEKAYRITSLNPTGRSMTLAFIDPGVTRAKEALYDDQTRVDRMAPHSGGSVSFTRDFAAAERAAGEGGLPLFIDFDAVWCGPCKEMDRWVYTADAVVDAAANVIAAKVDGDDFPEIAERFEVSAFPTMIRMNPDGEVTGRLIGYQGVEAMAAFLIGGDKSE